MLPTFTSSSVFFTLLLCLSATLGMDIPEYFPEIQGDLTNVSWAHAVNSRALLDESIQGDVMMLEADVSMGTVTGEGGGGEIKPIMAHPPKNTSDISLEDFLTGVISAGKRKGIKLDFKSTTALAPSLAILKSHSQQLTFPVWLNADILLGPAHNTGNPVDPETFLRESSENFPDSVLSVGWTTTWGPLYFNGSYTEEHVQEMIRTLKSNNVTQSVTFPIRGGIGAHSLTNVQTLLSSTPNSTLTIWSSDTDRVDVDKLRDLILTVGKGKVYVDVPQRLDDDLDLANHKSKTPDV